MNFIRIQLTGLLMLFFSLFPFSFSIADAQGPIIPVQIINVCNTGNVKFSIAVVKAEFNLIMPNEWWVRGWLHVPPGSCERADYRSSAAPYYLAFLQRDASGEPGIAVYEPTARDGYIKSSNRSFCVKLDVFDYEEKGEPTRKCPEPYMLAPFPIMISEAFGGTIETTLKIPASKDASLIRFPSQRQAQQPVPKEEPPAPPKTSAQTPAPDYTKVYPEYIPFLEASKKTGYYSFEPPPKDWEVVHLSFIEELGLMVYQKVFVDSLENNSFLEKAGLQNGDRIFSFNGKPVKDLADLEGSFFIWSFAKMLKPDLAKIELGIIRNEKQITPISIKSVPGIEEFDSKEIGGSLPGVKLWGNIVVVGYVYPPKVEFRLNIDVLYKVNGERIKSIGELKTYFKKLPPHEEMNLTIWDSEKDTWKEVKIQKIFPQEEPPKQSVPKPIPSVKKPSPQSTGVTIAQFDDLPLNKKEEIILSALKEQTSTRKEKECITAWFTTPTTSSLLPPVPDGRIEFDRNLEQPRINNSQTLLKDILDSTIDWVDQNKCPLDKAFASLINEAKKDNSLSVIAIPSPENEFGLTYLEKFGLVVYQNTFVESVDPNSILGVAGLKKGDRIHAVHPKEIIFIDGVGGEKLPDIFNFFTWYLLASERSIKKGKNRIENITLGVIRDDKKVTLTIPPFPIFDEEKLKEIFGGKFDEVEYLNYILKGDLFPGVTLVGGPILVMGYNYHLNASKDEVYPTLETDILSGINGKDIISIAQLNNETVSEFFKFTDFVFLNLQNSLNNNYKVLKREIPK